MEKVTHITVANLKEATFDDSKKTVVIPVLRECTSKNGYKYTKEIVEQFVPLLEIKRKMYADHSVNQRRIAEWAATIQEQWYEDGKAYVECKFTSPFAWLYEEAKTNPEEVSVSIDAVAVVEEVKEGKDSIYVVKKWIRAKSVDFVTENSVPGAKVERVNETLKSFVIFEAISDTLQYRLEQIKDNRDKWEYKWDITSALSQFMNDLTVVDPDDEDVRKEVEGRCDELVELLMKIPKNYAELWMSDSDNKEDGATVKEDKNLNKDDNLNDLGEDVMEKLTVQAVLEDTEVFNALKTQILKEVKENEGAKKLQEQLEKLQKEVDALKNEKIELQGKVDVMEAGEKKRELEGVLEAQLSEHKLSDVVTDEWKKMVLENATEESIKVHADTILKLKESQKTTVDDLKTDEKNKTSENEGIVEADSEIFKGM